MVELAEAVLNHVIDRRPDLCGDVGTRVLGQMTDDIVDVGFGERTHGVPSFQSFVMLESRDRKSTRLNSSHVASSYAVFCLKKKSNSATSTEIDRLRTEV